VLRKPNRNFSQPQSRRTLTGRTERTGRTARTRRARGRYYSSRGFGSKPSMSFYWIKNHSAIENQFVLQQLRKSVTFTGYFPHDGGRTPIHIFRPYTCNNNKST